MLKGYLLKIKQLIIYHHHRYLKKKQTYTKPLKLHLGCGSVYLEGYVNIDVSSNSVADVICDIQDIYKLYSKNSVSEIVSIHTISYLRLWEAIDFFKDCYNLLHEGGRLVLEFPDIDKCSGHLIKSRNDYTNYIEAVRGIYAFDLGQIQKRERFITYRFGWSAWHIEQELKNIGFKNVDCSDGLLHNHKWRDSRVEAKK